MCTLSDFIEQDTSAVRWLERDADYELAHGLWAALGHELSYTDWIESHDLGYTYAGIIADREIISCAAEWRYSERAWEVAAVVTRREWRRRDYSTKVVAFVTAHILQSGRLATCTTSGDNAAMLATAKRVGFRVIESEEMGH